MRKNLMISLIAGLGLCAWASAATVMVDAHSADTLGMATFIGTTLKIKSTIRIAHFMPEVYVGNGTRPGILQTDTEDSVPDEETLQDSSKE